MLQNELDSLKGQLARHYVLSIRKAELETPQSNIFIRAWNRFEYGRVVPEHEYFSEKRPLIKSRIEDIKDELKEP